MGVAADDGALRGDQRLRQHLAAEHPLPAVLRRMADETVFARRREIEQGDEFVSGHGLRIRLRERSRGPGSRTSTSPCAFCRRSRGYEPGRPIELCSRLDVLVGGLSSQTRG